MRILLLVALLACSQCPVNAQSEQHDRISYKSVKSKYDLRTYSYQTTDRYNPARCGESSMYLPGLGQMMAGETPRGLAFTSLFVSGFTLFFVGLSSEPFDSDYSDRGVFLMVTGAAATIGSCVWSSVDAVRVAKVKNLAYRDQVGTVTRSL